MPRIARLVVPGIPHHIVQRGNRNQIVFFSGQDKMFYLRLLKQQAEIYGLKFWAYCLMDNHVHLIAVPQTKESFKAIWHTHHKYTMQINSRKEWRGYLWQGRFSSFVMDERHLYSAVRYVECNPVRAGIVSKAWDYQWSSAMFHVNGAKDQLVEHCFLQDQIMNWKEYLNQCDQHCDLLRKHSSTGRPLGNESFIKELEDRFGRVLAKQKPGPKPKLSIVSP